MERYDQQDYVPSIFFYGDVKNKIKKLKSDTSKLVKSLH